MDEIETIAARHHIPLDAAHHLREALARGHGTMAQFNHPALGGMGQWHKGGMLMIGDMFNDELKARVGAFLNDLAPQVSNGAADAEASHEGSTHSDSSQTSSQWPKEFGTPSSSGSQNGARYAFFADAHRLMIVGGESDGTYDTGDHRISGVSQQQGNSSDLAFTSQNGPVRLSDLKTVETPVSSRPRERDLEPAHDKPAAPAHDKPAAHGPSHAPSASQPESSGPASASGSHASAGHRDDFSTLERLSELHAKKVLSDEEYKTKKAEILARF